MWEQDFSTGTSGWEGALTWNETAGTATVADGGQPFTRFDQYRSEWPGDWMAELDVYLDPSWAEGTNFEYSVATSNSSGGHLQDFVFHVGVDGNGLWVFGDNNSYGTGYQSPAAVSIPATGAGWYTLQQVFSNEGGVLAVTMNVLDSEGNTVYSTVLTNASNIIDPDPSIGNVGGNRYGWFTSVDVPGGLEIDNTRLSFIVPTPGTKDDCKDGGFTSFGFDNQGQCVASVTANANAG